jgi:hypothetical protein
MGLASKVLVDCLCCCCWLQVLSSTATGPAERFVVTATFSFLVTGGHLVCGCLRQMGALYVVVVGVDQTCHNDVGWDLGKEIHVMLTGPV